MHWRDPNRTEPLDDLRPAQRYPENPATGDAGRDGYTLVARRPRTPPGLVQDEIVPVERADRIEGIFAPLDQMDSY